MRALHHDIISYILDLALEGENDQAQLLSQVIRISRAWRAVAEQRLYASIELDRARSRKRTVILLCRTLQESPGITRMVKKLSLALVCNSAIGQNHAELIALCSSLSDLALEGDIDLDSDPQPLMTAIAGLDLRTLDLHLNQYNPADKYSSGLDIIRLLQTLPRIEEVAVSSSVISEYRPGGDAPCWLFESLQPEQTLHTCLPLVKLDLYEAEVLQPADIEGIRALSLPNLRVFSAGIDGEDRTMLLLAECLESWAAHLEDLNLRLPHEYPYIAPGTFFRLNLSEPIGRLRSLKAIVISARFCAEEALLSILTLSYVHYTDARLYGDLLASKLEEIDMEGQNQTPRYLPALSSLVLRIRNGHPSESEQTRLVKICRARRIYLELFCNGYRRKSHHYTYPVIDEPIQVA